MTNVSVSTTARAELVDITDRVAEAVEAAGVREGLATVYVPHTTAGITVNENADPDVVSDIVATLDRLVPRKGPYRHGEGNADAHIKSAMLGHSVVIPVRDGKLALGTWQGIFLCEFDGPRTRHVRIEVKA
jgi:secondary thiamine-phosphate synthase enzyme